MSFIEGLAKGFVRSAVNQVGRDGGKVISNKVYGDRHSTPIRVIGRQKIVAETEIVEGETKQYDGEINSREELKSNGYKAELFSTNVILYFFMYVGAFIIPLVGPIYWLYLSFKNIFKRTVRFYTMDLVPIYVRDRRYKTGARQEGYKKVRKYSNVEAVPKMGERILFISKGIIGILIFISLARFQYGVYEAVTTPEETVAESASSFGTVSTESGLNMRDSESGLGAILMTIPNNTRIEVISRGKEETMGSVTSNWLEVKYNDQIGWVWGGFVIIDNQEKSNTEN